MLESVLPKEGLNSASDQGQEAPVRHRFSRLPAPRRARAGLRVARNSAAVSADSAHAAALAEIELASPPIFIAPPSTASLPGLLDVPLPLAQLRPARRGRRAQLKRLVDFVGAALLLVLLAPLVLAIAIAIKLDSAGPVLFRQQRVGRERARFTLYKFRTMVDGADQLKSALLDRNDMSPPMFKIRNDPRVTRLGRMLRRRGLDELPQLLNVLRGDMSLVGPRPLVPDEDARVPDPYRQRRLGLAPGLTGPWQVMRNRHLVPFSHMVSLDCRYVAAWSLWRDLKLLLGTILVVRRGDSA